MTTQLLLNIQNSKHWDQQLTYLQQLQLNQATARLMNIPKNTDIIKNLLTNPRSKVLTSTVQFLIEIFQKQGPLLHNFAYNLLRDQILFKLLNSANKVIYSCVHELFKAILINCPHSKFYPILTGEMNSKNSQVRQAISSYLLYLADTIEFPGNFGTVIGNWRNDPNKAVRDNIGSLEELINKAKEKEKEKERQTVVHAQKDKKQKPTKTNTTKQQNKQNIPITSPIAPTLHLKNLHPKNPHPQSTQPPQHQNSQLILQSFTKNNNPQNSYLDIYSNIDFLISKIHSDQTWNMKIFAIQQISQIFNQNYGSLTNQYFQKILAVFVYLVSQKRSKTYINSCQLIKNAMIYNQQLFNKFISNIFTQFIQKLGKIQQHGPQLITLTIKLNPNRYILKLAQITTQIKSLKQKITLLDILVQMICQYKLPFSKASIIIKELSKNIQKYYLNKQVYLPCMAVLSHFKLIYPSQFLSLLLCMEKDTLNKILSIAESIDPKLREQIVLYIHSVKNYDKNNSNKQKEKKQQNYYSQQQYQRNYDLEKLLQEVINDQQNSVTKLVEYIFDRQQQITIRQFYDIIKLTQNVCSQNSLLELQLLLEQICRNKVQNQKFLQALFQAVTSSSNQNSLSFTIQSQYIVAYLRKIYNLLTNYPKLLYAKFVNKLISVYRLSKCPKVRLLCIKNLGLFSGEVLAGCVNAKEKELILAQCRVQYGGPELSNK